jgi:hypothetical protein
LTPRTCLLSVSIEVKTKAPKIEEGAAADLTLALVEIDNPRAKAVLEDLMSLLGPEFRGTERPLIPDTKQLREFFEQSTQVVRWHGQRAAQLGVVTGNWSAVRRVLARAFTGSPSLDIAEEGVWLAAIRATNDTAAFEPDLLSLRQLARTRVPHYDSGRISFATTLHLERNEFAGALTLPVAVWKLPPFVRAQVLNGDLVLMSYVDIEVLRGHLAGFGIECELGDDAWEVRRGDVEFSISKAAATRVRLDVSFGGLSLRSFAARIDERLELEARKQPNTGLDLTR